MKSLIYCTASFSFPPTLLMNFISFLQPYHSDCMPQFCMSRSIEGTYSYQNNFSIAKYKLHFPQFLQSNDAI